MATMVITKEEAKRIGRIALRELIEKAPVEFELRQESTRATALSEDKVGVSVSATAVVPPHADMRSVLHEALEPFVALLNYGEIDSMVLNVSVREEHYKIVVGGGWILEDTTLSDAPYESAMSVMSAGVGSEFTEADVEQARQELAKPVTEVLASDVADTVITTEDQMKASLADMSGAGIAAQALADALNAIPEDVKEALRYDPEGDAVAYAIETVAVADAVGETKKPRNRKGAKS